MKIRTMPMDYDEVMKLKPFAHKPPRRPNLLFRTLVRAAASGELKKARFTCRSVDMEKVGDGPYLILMNHSSFIDLMIVSKVMYPKPYAIICTSDGFVGKEGLMRSIGCFPTNKFVTDLQLVADMRHALTSEKCSVLMYPEASYSFDGTATPLPWGLGALLKRLGAPVVGILTEGAFSRDPLYNGLQKRDVAVSATVRGLLSAEEIRQKSVAELDSILDGMFSFDNFRWQAENGIEITEPFRADGLERILYKCPACGAEGAMEGRGTGLTCRQCGKRWEMDTLGRLRAMEGETEFPHIPDWYAWERREVRGETERGTYRLDCPVDIAMLRDFRAIYRVGEGRLVHSAEGFHLTGCDGRLDYRRPADASYSLYADFYWYELGDIICIGDREALYYCFPRTKIPVAKARLATEELFRLKKSRTGQT